MSCKRCGKTSFLEVHHIDGNHDNNNSENLMQVCAVCHAILENRAPNLAQVKVQYENLRDLENTRIRLGNRVIGLEKWDIDTSQLKSEVKTILKLEREMKKKLIDTVEDLEIFKWLNDIRGIAGRTAAELIALIGNISRFGKISSLWHYAGLHVENGEAPKPRKGQRMNYNPRLKSLCLGIIGKNFIRLRSPYRQFYDEKKAYYETNREWTKGHRHNAAIRYMVKEFVKNLWLKWRGLENLPLTEPHPQDKPRWCVKPSSPLCNLAGGNNLDSLSHPRDQPIGRVKSSPDLRNLVGEVKEAVN